MAPKIWLLCLVVLIVPTNGQGLFDFDNMMNNLFPSLQKGTGSSSSSYPHTPPANSQLNNPGGSIWNNGNDNSGSNNPGNSQYYPGNGVQGINNGVAARPGSGWNQLGNLNNQNGQLQGNHPLTDTGRGWNRPPAAGADYPAQGSGGKYPGYNNNNWNSNIRPNTQYPAGVNYPQNGIQAGNTQYPQNNWNGDGRNPNMNYPAQGYPDEKIQKLNPPYGNAGKPWNNGNLNSGINYPGDAQSYPTNGYQNQGFGNNPRGINGPGRRPLVPGNVRQGPVNVGRGGNQDAYNPQEYAGHPQQPSYYLDENRAPLVSNSTGKTEAKQSNNSDKKSLPNPKSAAAVKKDTV
ncbi:unnamed protein product [Leptidea sinapis]|uniref:Uncharacterized protein n=1 Tax=Leptidea sinapis TaxID=189913 RepID=A0A5E4R4D5_9NEOP|nr:unnamed protein product [Leptidea sinapis]